MIVLADSANVCFRLRIQPVNATPPLFAQSLVCCIHRLNPQPIADIPTTSGKFTLFPLQRITMRLHLFHQHASL
jgi:hypothetical protein